MRNSLLIILTLASVAGCGPQEGLGEFSPKTMDVSARYAADSYSTVVGVDVYLWGPDNHCPVAKSDLQGTVNGVPLTVESLGFNDDNDFSLGFTTSCLAPHLTGPFSGSGPLDIRVWDSTGSVSATFAASFEERTLELVEPSDGRLYIGDKVVLRYGPASDDLLDDGNIKKSIHSNFWGTSFERDGELLSFVVPDAQTNLREEQAELSLYAVVESHNTSCKGADDCVLRPGIGTVGQIPVTIVRAERNNASACYQCDCKYTDGSSRPLWSEGPEGDFLPTHCSAIQCGESGDRARTVASATCVARTALEVRLPWPHQPGKGTPPVPPQ